MNNNKAVIRKQLPLRIIAPSFLVVFTALFAGITATLSKTVADVVWGVVSTSIIFIIFLVWTLYAFLWKMEIEEQKIIVRKLSKREYLKSEIRINIERIPRRRVGYVDLYVVRLKENDKKIISFRPQDDNIKALDDLMYKLGKEDIGEW